MAEVKGMSEQEEDISRLSQEGLGQEDLAKLIKKAIDEGEKDAKFILTLDVWSRPGQSFEDYGRFKVIYGKIETIELDRQYNYPTTNLTTYAIIPKSKAVVIIFEQGDDYEGELERHEKLYVFSHSIGWKSISLY